VRILMKWGARPGARDAEGKTALLMAARAGQREAVVELFERFKTLDPKP
jgi:ankyrin repeat protein